RTADATVPGLARHNEGRRVLPAGLRFCLCPFRIRIANCVPDGIAFAPSTFMNPKTVGFYQGVLEAAKGSGIPFLIGGGFALGYYTGIERYTKDLDIFVTPRGCKP